jgi:hypothetical protein
LGKTLLGIQVPPETGRLYEAARIAGRATSDAPESVVFGNGQLPESIIQARMMNPPSFDPDTPPDSLGYLSQGRGGDTFFDQQEILLPGWIQQVQRLLFLALVPLAVQTGLCWVSQAQR